jgi:hypothetical protein
VSLLRSCILLPAIAIAGCTAAPRTEDATLESTILGLERDSWKAWHAQDAAFFETFLAEDHVEVSVAGPADKGTVLRFISSGSCRVANYAISDFRFTRLSDTSAMLVYRVRQDTTCGGHAVPSPAWATSVFALREGRWQNILYQQLPAKP